MISFSLQQLADITGGRLIGHDAQTSASIQITSVTTDTRQVEAGALFVALIGERFDAHDFCQQALDNQAAGLLASKSLDLPIAQVVVEDTQIALGLLGAWMQQQSHAQTLALTGSCGKTTVKEMLAAILKQKGQVLATNGNFNNEIGVPLTLLRSQTNDDYAVIELGANHLGEIAYTTQLVKPSVALVNNVAAAHLEGFGSIDGVAKAKGEIFQGLPSGGTAIINLDSNGLEHWQATLSDKNVVTFSEQNPQADFFAQDIQMQDNGQASFTLVSPQGRAKVLLPMIGQHNVANGLAAAAMATQVGASLDEIVQGLQTSTNVSGRVEAIELTDNIRLIDDSYNASVPAMNAAVDLLANYSGKRWLILGFMAELGQESVALHRQVGEHAAQFNFDYVLTFGEDTAIISQVCHNEYTCSRHFTSHTAMIEFIIKHLNTDIQKRDIQTAATQPLTNPLSIEEQAESKHTLLIKGAHSSQMSLVVAALKENYA
ncbi:UDP-N-acetylmuramoyl-tripeptide--D-alanyl-D-alanine ligase [Vibrio algicola]|uniref:UDP-N-acetylmuramoyl-tripeptide--D-alanyl-D-alanine ligase n=1 Tax=Vibrio algicola TaxID=2662262 RepID=A0A5Q0TAX9_9VIBR|nr:UDP-N-acetylmuramoyl-tripeptide--D-alanyl-D-alanine ligase [Vibrio algicola]